MQLSQLKMGLIIMSNDLLNVNLSTKSWAVRMADSILPTYPESKWKWHYEDGLLVMAISSIGSQYASLGQRWVDHFVTTDGEIKTYRVGEYNLDQILPGRLILSILTKTGGKQYLKAANLLKSQLDNQQLTSEGGYWHKQIYPHQMWLDGLYMAEPFNAEWAVFSHNQHAFDDITHQFILLEKQTRDPQTGLLYHGWDESRSQKWANSLTGCSPHFWGRSMGWFVMAVVEVLDFLPTSHPNHPVMVDMLSRLAQALVRQQDANSGMWYQIVDLPHKTGNYLESSVTAMLAYGFAKGVRMGWLPAEYLSSARRAYHGLLENMVRLDTQGNLSLQNICSVAGLGGEPYRDGSFDYYIHEPVVVNDFKGVGSFILAALEMDLCDQKQAH